MSTRWWGAASRSFISGIRLWPPDRTLASSPHFARSAVASPSELGAWYSKAPGIIVVTPFWICPARVLVRLSPDRFRVIRSSSCDSAGTVPVWTRYRRSLARLHRAPGMPRSRGRALTTMVMRRSVSEEILAGRPGGRGEGGGIQQAGDARPIEPAQPVGDGGARQPEALDDLGDRHAQGGEQD